MRGVLIGIVGPTATGKTAVGLELAKALDGEIISADSMAVYRGMNIGTAKPTPEEQAAAPIHLIDVVDPDQEFSAADFRELADEALKHIVSRGRQPLLVGGTGLYIKSFAGALNIPAVAPDKELRASLQAEAESLGGEALLDRLRKVDAITAARLHPRDLKRIIRALEVHTLTGRPISELHKEAGRAPTPYPTVLFGLTLSRPALYERIERRVDAMIQAGLVEEVRGLLEKGYSAELPSMKALGYKQVCSYLAGECNLDTAVDFIKRDTRRFAKRQLTWFRADQSIHWIDIENRTAAETAYQIRTYEAL